MDVDPPSDEHGAPDDAMAAEVQMSSSFQEDYEYTVSSRPVLKTPEDALAYWNLSLERDTLSCHHFREWWRRVVPRYMSPSPSMDYQSPLAHIDDAAVEEQLLKPLERFICDGNPDEVMEKLSKLNDPPSQCGKLFKMGEPTYSCKDCGHDPTCVLCVDCFKNSEHRHHRYKMSTSGGGGYCDCGDNEAWSDHVHCAVHILGTKGGEKTKDPLANMPLHIQKRTEHVFKSIMRYAFAVLTQDTVLNVLPDLTYKDETIFDPIDHIENEDTYSTVVYNDEFHTFDEVINTLPRAVDCDRNSAIGFATLIDREGRAIVKCSGFQGCNEAKRITERITSRRGSKPLKVVIMHSHVVAHQNFAMRVLTWLQNILDFSSGFRSLFCSIVLERGSSDRTSIVQDICSRDTTLWKSARTLMHHMLISGMLMENEAKKRFACEFTKHYGNMMKDFIHDDHEHSFSITSLSVQLFTVPTIAHYLIANEFALPILLRTFVSEVGRKRNPKGKIEFQRNFNSNSYKRCFYTMFDVKYILTTPPASSEEWDDNMRKGFLHGLSLYLDVLLWMQGMDLQVRQTSHHVEYELEWESAFNLHIRLAPVSHLLTVWCGSDRVVFIKAMRMLLKKLNEDWKQELELEESDDEAPDPKIKQTVLDLTYECINYQVSSRPISIHAPLTRLLAGLSLYMQKFDLTLDSPELACTEKPSIIELLEPSMRVISLIAQVQGGMWRRNGYSLVDQVRVYHDPRCRREMYDQDIIMLQLACANLPPDEFLVNLLNKFQLIHWAERAFDCAEDDSIRQVISLVEEFLSTLIIILSERFTPGIGEVTVDEALKKEIIQLLCVEPMSHSMLNKALSEDVTNRDTGMERVINSVANFKKPTGGSGRGMYELKEEFYSEYNVFFYHYTKEDQSKSEEAQRARQKAANLPLCNPPPKVPPFTKQFEKIIDMTHCKILIHIFALVLQRADNLKTRCFSESQVHKVLHLMALCLHEQERMTEKDKNAVKFTDEAMKNHDMLKLLEQLVGNQRIVSHKELLNWVIRKWRQVAGDAENASTSATGISKNESGADESGQSEAMKRKAAAAARRAKIMAQMKSAQKNFMKENAHHFQQPGGGSKNKDVSMEEEEEEDEMIMQCEVKPVSLGVNKTAPVQESISHICILCQDEQVLKAEGECLVMAAYVQNSTVLSRRRFQPDMNEETMFETPPQYASCPILLADMPCSPYTSSCGHIMHSHCWQKYYDDIVTHERQRNSRLRHSHSYDVEKNEFLCPLCRCISNTVIPIIPQFHVLQPPVGFRVDMNIADWLQALSLALKYKRELTDSGTGQKPKTEEDSKPGPSSISTSRKRYYTCPLDQVVQELQTTTTSKMYARFYTDNEGSELQFSVSVFAMMNLFSQAVFRNSLDALPDHHDERIPLMVWQTCAYTIHATIFTMSDDGKSIYKDMSSRQKDCLSTLVRFCGVVGSNFGEPKFIRSHSLKLLSTLMEVDSDNLCILEFDAFGMLVALTFSLPSLFNGNHAAPLPACNVQDQLIFQLLFTLHVVQIMSTTDQFSPPDEDRQTSSAKDKAAALQCSSILDLLGTVRKTAGFSSEGDGFESLDAVSVWKDIKQASLPFVRCAAIFYHHLSSVPFPAGLKEESENEFENLMDFLGLQSTPSTLFSCPKLISVVERWIRHPQVQIMLSQASKTTPVTYPIRVNPPITLPTDYSELINALSSFTCPKSIADDSRVPAMCLICGHIMCSQSYCCQQTIKDNQVGACTAHANICGAGNGVFLRVRECKVVLLSGRSKGCFIQPPYLDQYGEADIGLKRGNPLSVCEERLKKIRKLWFTHGIPEEISHALESNLLLVATPWHHL